MFSRVQKLGGNEASERKRAIVAPDYFEPTEADYEMVLIELNYPSKFVKLTHRNVLGTIMSLGIDRNQLGDIIVNEYHILEWNRTQFDSGTFNLC